MREIPQTAPPQRDRKRGQACRKYQDIQRSEGFSLFFSCSFFRFLRASHEGDPTDCTTTKGQKTGGNIKILKDLRGFLLVIVVLIRISRE